MILVTCIVEINIRFLTNWSVNHKASIQSSMKSNYSHQKFNIRNFFNTFITKLQSLLWCIMMNYKQKHSQYHKQRSIKDRQYIDKVYLSLSNFIISRYFFNNDCNIITGNEGFLQDEEIKQNKEIKIYDLISRVNKSWF